MPDGAGDSTSLRGERSAQTRSRTNRTTARGLLATLGQAVTPGIVNGLVLSVDTSTPDSLLTVTPGYGIAASGEDVSLFRALQTRLSTLSVIDSITGVQITDPHTDLPANFQGYMAGTSVPPVGLSVLQPIAAEANGSMFDQGTGPLEVSTNLNASCDRDPQEYAFEDWQVVEAVIIPFRGRRRARPCRCLPRFRKRPTETELPTPSSGRKRSLR